jgi:hypothetical protein
MTSAASSGNDGGRQRQWKQRQRRGHTTINQQTAATWRQKDGGSLDSGSGDGSNGGNGGGADGGSGNNGT